MDICSAIWCHTDKVGAATVWAAMIALLASAIVASAAFVIGRGQLRLMEYQAHIQKDFLEHERNKVRVELFDRRMNIVNAMNDLMNFFVVNDRMPISRLPQNPPNGVGIPQAQMEALRKEREIRTEFMKATETSSFLFSKDVSKELVTLRAKVLLHDAISRKIAHNRPNLDMEKAQDDLDNTAEEIQSIEIRLGKLFRKEIRPVSDEVRGILAETQATQVARRWGLRGPK